MTLLDAVHSEAGTFHWFAAACTSISRAAAPPLRTYSCDSRMPRLPPVENSPQGRLRFTLSPGVGYSMRTFDQSHSSSSATSCARPVIVPCPISERTTRIFTVSSGAIATQTPTSGEPSCARATAGPNGRRKPSARPPVTAAEVTRNVRRFISMSSSLDFGVAVGCHVDRFPHLLERSATADVGDRGVDVRVGRIRFVFQQRGGGHDHARLAIAALRHVVLQPGLLHLVQLPALREAFDGGDLLAGGRAHRKGARAHGRAVDVHGAGAALRDAATVFGASESDLLANNPQQRRIRVNVDLVRLAVDGETDHAFLLPWWKRQSRRKEAESYSRISTAVYGAMRSKSSAISLFRMRMQPIEPGFPISAVSGAPWI